jgi:hypothetical protein
LINDIENRASHGRKVVDSKYMGLIIHEEAAQLATIIKGWEDLHCIRLF